MAFTQELLVYIRAKENFTWKIVFELPIEKGSDCRKGDKISSSIRAEEDIEVLTRGTRQIK